MNAGLEDAAAKLRFRSPFQTEHLGHRSAAHDEQIDDLGAWLCSHLAFVPAVSGAKIDGVYALCRSPFELPVGHDLTGTGESETFVVAAGDTVLADAGAQIEREGYRLSGNLEDRR